MIALNLCNALVAFALPNCYGIELVPGGKQLRLLARNTQMILVAHIEIGAGNGTTRPRRWLRLFEFKVDLHLTLAVLLLAAVPLTVGEVATVAIHFTHRRLQVVQVGFDAAVVGIFAAVFTTAILQH